MLTSEKRRYASSVNARSVPQKLAVFAEPTQDCFINTLPKACLHPFVKATPARHAAAAAELTREILPRYPSPENEKVPVRPALSLTRGRPPLAIDSGREDGGR